MWKLKINRYGVLEKWLYLIIGSRDWISESSEGLAWARRLPIVFLRGWLLALGFTDPPTLLRFLIPSPSCVR
jgi:hypothetical protein